MSKSFRLQTPFLYALKRNNKVLQVDRVESKIAVLYMHDLLCYPFSLLSGGVSWSRQFVAMEQSIVIVSFPRVVKWTKLFAACRP